MERFIKDERTGISYELIGDYYYPCLTSPASPNIGRYGRMRWRYLKEHRQVFYSQLVLSDKLASYLEEIDQSASEMMERLIKDMAERQGRDGTAESRKSTALGGNDEQYPLCRRGSGLE